MIKVLVSAGSTRVPIDQVRCISNIFNGKTGTNIAIGFGKANCDVTLLTSAPLNSLPVTLSYYIRPENIINYKTYDDLYDISKKLISNNNFDIIVWSAAVSDYKVEGVYEARQTYQDFILDRMDSSKKISGSNPEVYLKLVPTEKIIDKIRRCWGFKGQLVKFKLQVGIVDELLISIAKESRKDSDADFIVANCLEWSKDRAYIIDREDNVQLVNRDDLAINLTKLLLK